MVRTSKRTGNGTVPSKPRLEGFPNGLVTKNTTIDALLQSLQSLSSQLSAFQQDEVDLSSINPVLPALVDGRMMLHKDKGVKAYLCVCLAEVLKLYAPEAPYTQDELADIFQFFFRQLTHLGGGAGDKTAYYAQYHHLLESLSEVKSIVLVCDLERWDEVFVDVAKDCFNIVRKSASFGAAGGLPQKVEMYIADILGALVDEAPSVPESVMELLLSPFQEVSAPPERELKGKLRDNTKGTVPGGSQSPLHRVATKVLNDTKDKIQRYIGVHFTDIIVRASQAHAYPSSSAASDASSDDEDRVGKSDSLSRSQLSSLTAAHNLIKSLHLSAPGVLLSVIPQLEAELSVSSTEVRLLAVNTLGAMYSRRGAELIRSHPTTWTQWIARQNDKDAPIRIAFVSQLRGLLYLSSSHPEITKCISAKLLDPDEKVRYTLIHATFTQPPLEYEHSVRQVPVEVWKEVAGRGLDKKESVRKEAIKAVGLAWGAAYSEVASNDQAAKTHFGWIPAELLSKLHNSGSQEVRSLVEQAAHEHLFPLPGSHPSPKGKEKEASYTQSQGTDLPNGASTSVERQRVDRLLTTLKFIAIAEGGDLADITKSVDRVLGMGSLRVARPSLYHHYLTILSSPTSAAAPFKDQSTADKPKPKTKDEKTARLETIIQALAPSIASSQAPAQVQRVRDDLWAFSELVTGGDSRLGSLAKKVIDGGYGGEAEGGGKAVGKATADFMKRLHSASSSLVPTMSTFVRKGSLRIVDASMIPPLLDVLRTGSEAFGTDSQSQRRTARRDTMNPAELRTSHAKAILLYIAKWRPELFGGWLEALVEIMDDEDVGEDVKEVALRGLSVVAQMKSELVRDGVPAATHNRIRTLVLHTTNWRLAKSGAKYLAFAGKLVGGGEGEEEMENEDVIGVAEAIAEIFESALSKPAEEADDEYVLSHVVTLAQFARYALPAFERRSRVFVKYLQERVMMILADEPGREAMDENASEWLEDIDMSPFLRTKIQTLKCLRWRALSYASAYPNGETAVEVSSPVFRLLTSLLEHMGSLDEANEDEDPRVKARLRLQAAVSLVKICTEKRYDECLAAWFLRIAVFIQDSSFEVRSMYLHKMTPTMFARKLPVKFNVIPFLAAQDPEKELTARARNYVTMSQARMTPPQRLRNFELPFIQLLEVLSQHPDFERNLEGIKDFRIYLDMYFGLVLSQENISLLYHLAGKGKTVETKDPDACEKFWTLCELSQELMKIHAHRKGWNINNFPGKVRMPLDLFTPFPDSDATNANIRKVYLPHDALNWLQEEGAQTSVGGTGGKRKRGDGEGKPKGKKRKSVPDEDDGLSSDFPMDAEDTKPARSKKKQTSKSTILKTRKKVKKEDSEDDDGEDEDESEFESRAKVKAKPKAKKEQPKPKPRPKKKGKTQDEESDIEMRDDDDEEKPVATRRSARHSRGNEEED